MTDSITAAEAKARGYDPASVRQYEAIERARAEALKLIPDIEAAFEGVPRPQITLSVAKGYDDEWNLTDERIEELAAQDPERVWQDVSDEALEARQEYFTFSDAAGWLFYLPAFMCHYLRRFPADDWDAVYQACGRRTHFDLLNEAQLRCVDRFIELCRKHQWRR
jgi:hypothetical protein